MRETEAAIPNRPRGWRLFGLVGVVLALLLLSYVLYIHAVTRRRWADMERSLEKQRAESDLRNGPRPVLRGTAVPGSAWDDYSPALALMRSAPMRVLADYVNRSPAADRQKLQVALATHGTALDALRKGAMRADGIYRMKWAEGFEADIPGVLQSQNLIHLAVCRSRLLIEKGQPREAAELLLDSCQFAHDLGYNQLLISEMISVVLYGIALQELHDLILSDKLSNADLAEVARELEILDGSFPQNGHSMLNEAMAAGYTFLKTRGSPQPQDLDFGAGPGPGWDSFVWKTAFPGRLICADAYFVELDDMKRFAAADGQSWSTYKAVRGEVEAEAEKLRNPVSRMIIPGLTSSSYVGRERRAQLRLLRAAAHYRATGEMPEIADPFGMKLLSSTQGRKFKIWSVGKDGVDSGGKGDWKPSAGPDIVLEFDR